MLGGAELESLATSPSWAVWTCPAQLLSQRATDPVWPRPPSLPPLLWQEPGGRAVGTV